MWHKQVLIKVIGFSRSICSWRRANIN